MALFGWGRKKKEEEEIIEDDVWRVPDREETPATESEEPELTPDEPEPALQEEPIVVSEETQSSDESPEAAPEPVTVEEEPEPEPETEPEEEPEPEPEPYEEPEEPQKKEGFFARLFKGLQKTRDNFIKNMDYVFRGFTNIDDEFYEELEEVLIMGDIGVRTTDRALEELKQKVKEQKIKEPLECKQLLIDTLRQQMDIGETAYEFEHRKSVVLVVGVNGVGKTTTIGKLSSKFKKDGKKVVLAAADTFRAAAAEQLTEWANRANVDIIKGQEGSDPGSVVYDAVQAAKSRDADILLVDTAGRLHNKKNLMAELSKINRIIEKEYPEAFRETLIVLDATTGQNALNQAKEFSEVTDVSGIVLTKMDGTAKGGIAVAIQSELNVPVKYIGVGETLEDLEKFNADQFVEALFMVDGPKED